MSKPRNYKDYPALLAHFDIALNRVRGMVDSHLHEERDVWETLFRLAKEVGAPWVDVQPLSIKGLTTRSRIILVDSNQSTDQQSVTLAHEIAHLLLSREVVGGLLASTETRSKRGTELRDAVESFCSALGDQMILVVKEGLTRLKNEKANRFSARQPITSFHQLAFRI